MDRYAVLSSGGLDSTTALAMMVNQARYTSDVLSISIYYGQRHSKELECAREIAKYFAVKHIEFDLSTIFEGSNCALLGHSNEAIPEESYNDQLEKLNGEPVTTYVPFRNGLMLAVATSIAYSQGFNKIVYGAHHDDAAGNAYPDCSPEFYESMNKAIYEGTSHKVELYAPFIKLTKADIVREGLEIGVPYEKTWSCYEGGELPCGICGTCRDRIAAFRANGVEDPLQYATK